MHSTRLTRVVAIIFAVFSSLLWALLGVMNVLFADIVGIGQHVLAVMYVGVVYVVLVTLASTTDASRPRAQFWIYVSPMLLVVLLMAIAEPGRSLYTSGVLGSSLGGIWLGGRIGRWVWQQMARVRERQQRVKPPTPRH